MAKWELVYHDDHPNYYAHYVTAKCSECGKRFYGNEHFTGRPDNKYGAKIWSGFCTNYSDETKVAFEQFALSNAEKSVGLLPAFCCYCGARFS